MKVNINAGLPCLRSRATSCKYTGLTWVSNASSIVASLFLEELNTRFFLDGFKEFEASKFLGKIIFRKGKGE